MGGAIFCGVKDTQEGKITMPAEAALGQGRAEGVIPNWFRSKQHGYYAPSGFMAARARLLEVGLPADGIRCWEDSEMFGRLVLRYPAGYISEVLTYYHREAEGRLIYSRWCQAPPPVIQTLERALAGGRAPPEQRGDIREYIAKLLLVHATHLLLGGRRLCCLRVLRRCRYTRAFAGRWRELFRSAIAPNWLRRLKRALGGPRGRQAAGNA